MPNPDAAWNRTYPQGEERWRRLGAVLPMRAALVAVAVVWLLGCVWSFEEQSAFAASKDFTFPHLLPLVIDGFAASMAGVAWAASLDARPAIPARLATLIAVAASSASNGVWAYQRAHHDVVTVVLGMTIPVAANLAFEVLLAELRRQVQRRRGLPPPVAVPYPRMIRIVLAPWQTFHAWRTLVLEITAIDHSLPRKSAEVHTPLQASDPAAQPGTPTARERDGRLEVSIPPLVRASAVVMTTHAEPATGPQSAHRATNTTRSSIEWSGTSDREAKVGQAVPVEMAHSPQVDTTSSPSIPPTGPWPANLPPPAAFNPNPDDSATHDRDRVADHAGTTASEPMAEADDWSVEHTVDRRMLDPRVLRLAKYMHATDSSDEITGDMVGSLLGIDVAPRTGRRLLGQARALIDHEDPFELDMPNDPEPSAVTEPLPTWLKT
jgi:hypothetical protein